jgi:hypothetical protein
MYAPTSYTLTQISKQTRGFTALICAWLVLMLDTRALHTSLPGYDLLREVVLTHRTPSKALAAYVSTFLYIFVRAHTT